MFEGRGRVWLEAWVLTRTGQAGTGSMRLAASFAVGTASGRCHTITASWWHQPETKHLPFPPCRVALGAKIDAELADRKGRMMQALLDRYKSGGGRSSSPPESGSKHSPPAAPPAIAEGGGASVNGSATPSIGCPFGHSSVPAAKPTAAALAAAEAVEREATGFETARHQLYAWDAVPGDFRDMVSAEAAQQAQQLGLVPMSTAGNADTDSGSSAQGSKLPGLPLAFLDHAWGQVPPLAQVRFTAQKHRFDLI